MKHVIVADPIWGCARSDLVSVPLLLITRHSILNPVLTSTNQPTQLSFLQMSTTSHPYGIPYSTFTSVIPPTETWGASPSGGSNTPSIYLICFVVIICILLSISLFVAIRAVLIRRRIHAAWAASGFAEDFFENHPSIPTSITGLGRMGTQSVRAEWGLVPPPQNRGRSNGKSKKLGKKPEMWEVELCDEDSWTYDEPVYGVNEGKRKSQDDEWDGLRGRVGWKNISPISLIHIPSPTAMANGDAAQGPTANPLHAHGPKSKLFENARPNTRSTASVPFPASSIHAPGLAPPIQTLESLLPGQSQIEISVVIALPVDPIEEERRREKRQSDPAYNVEEDEGEDLPELWLSTERVLIG